LGVKEKFGWFWLFQEEIINEGCGALRPRGNMLREQQAENRYGKEEGDQDDKNQMGKLFFHLFCPFGLVPEGFVIKKA